MLAHDDLGSGAPLLLIHGTPSSRREWLLARDRLAEHRRVIAIDLPGFGESPPIPGASTPRDWVAPIGRTLDALGVGEPAVVGSSMGGWTALELGRAGRVSSILAFAPAGLWRRHPLLTDARILQGQLMARLAPRSAITCALAHESSRRRALRNVSVDAGRIPADVAIASLGDGLDAPGWWPHYRAARRTRFTGGSDIDPAIPVRVVFGDADRIARPGSSRRTDQLPAHATVETWPGCGHLVVWDATDRAIEAMLELP